MPAIRSSVGHPDPRHAISTSSRSTLTELIGQGTRPTFSFELFPPKDSEQSAVLWRTVRELESMQADLVSVTYGANGSTRDRTVAVTAEIATHTTLRVMGHLTAASQTVEDVRRVIRSYAAAGIRHVMAIRGDMPGGPMVPFEQHPGGLANATELVELVAALGDFCIGVGAFPDIHPASADADLDARILVDKAHAGASFAITQLFFSADSYDRLVDRVRARGSDLPIIPGIMPVTRLSQIQRFAELSGADLPGWVVDRLNAAGEDPEAVRQVGVDIATELCEELLDRGVPGLHYITMNRSTATREIHRRLAAD